MNSDRSLPAAGLVDVRITAASPDVARQVAEVLRRFFAGTEQRSYPAGEHGTGTRLHLTVDTTRTPEPTTSGRPWPVPATRPVVSAHRGKRPKMSGDRQRIT